MRKTADEARVHCYGNDEIDQGGVRHRPEAATMPAMTDVPGWAEELVTQLQGDFMFPLMPDAIFPRLVGAGHDRSTSAAPAASTSRRGSGPRPSPARSSAKASPSRSARRCFAAQIVTPKKLGVITVMTREIEQHSIPAIEGLLRRAIMEDTGESIDNILLDTNPADDGSAAWYPQRHHADACRRIQAAETSGFYRMVRDIRRLKAALIGPTNDNVRAPCWIMNPIRVDAIALNPAPGTGLFPFRDEVRGGNLEGWPIYREHDGQSEHDDRHGRGGLHHRRPGRADVRGQRSGGPAHGRHHPDADHGRHDVAGGSGSVHVADGLATRSGCSIG